MPPLFTMPVPPAADHPNFAFCQTFVHAMNSQPRTMATAMRVFAAIDIAAERMETSPAHISRVLVDCGLRAPRAAFPSDFLDFVDRCPVPRTSVQRAALGTGVIELKEFWDNLQQPNAGPLFVERA